MRSVYIAGHNIITSLGITTAENMAAMEAGAIGIRMTSNPRLFPTPIPLSLVDSGVLEEKFEAVLAFHKKTDECSSFTRLEKFLIISVHEAIAPLEQDFRDNRTLFVVSTTKGNIDLLETRSASLFPPKRIYLWEMARIVGSFFGFANPPMIISNACISGIMALMAAFRYMKSGLYDQAVVTGGDILSEFVISGFQSFQSISPNPCRPYDAGRDGLSLGEGAGTMVLTTKKTNDTEKHITIAGAATSNDANHISGPSRTGEELALAMQKSMTEAGLSPSEMGFINAHGTATPFNDEMESKAIALAGLVEVPVNSFKGYWGHTLGAAGLIESVASIQSLKNQRLIRSAGFETLGVPEPIRVIASNEDKEISSCMKSASGFGGCNAAIMFELK
ncbi:MAG: beta-ketoacyl synthase [Bacteroidales bacterium]|nr:beta-ketoacyl synthase [Bacteroidales bacterium]